MPAMTFDDTGNTSGINNEIRASYVFKMLTANFGRSPQRTYIALMGNGIF
jgi:hypothetical protein